MALRDDHVTLKRISARTYVAEKKKFHLKQTINGKTTKKLTFQISIINEMQDKAKKLIIYLKTGF